MSNEVTKTLGLSAMIWREENLYVAWCPEVDVTSQGKNIEEALSNLKEALELYFSDEDVEKPVEREPPVITMIKVKVK